MDALYLEGCKQAKALNYFRHINYTIEQCSILFLFFFLLFSFHQCKIDKLLILFTIHKCKLNLKDGTRKSKFHAIKSYILACRYVQFSYLATNEEFYMLMFILIKLIPPKSTYKLIEMNIFQIRTKSLKIPKFHCHEN